MVKSKIIYDSVIRTREEWENYLGEFKQGSNTKEFDYDLMDNQYFNALQSHYFAILNNSPEEIKNKIRMQVKEKLGIEPIAEEAVLGKGKNCEVYRISTPRKITIYRKDILDKPSAWFFDKTLHSKGAKAINNLIKKLENNL